MIYSVNISAQADKDIRAIYEYIALTLMSSENANAQLSRLEDRINKRAYSANACNSYCNKFGSVL